MKKFSIKGFKRTSVPKQPTALESEGIERADDDAVRPRTSRFVSTQKGWFVKTRENEDLGPFPSRSAAQEALSHFIRHRGRTTSRQESEDYKLGYSVHDVETCRRDVCAVCIEAAEEAYSIQKKRNGT